jgi:hypothetical protein
MRGLTQLIPYLFLKSCNIRLNRIVTLLLLCFHPYLYLAVREREARSTGTWPYWTRMRVSCQHHKRDWWLPFAILHFGRGWKVTWEADKTEILFTHGRIPSCHIPFPDALLTIRTKRWPLIKYCWDKICPKPSISANSSSVHKRECCIRKPNKLGVCWNFHHHYAYVFTKPWWCLLIKLLMEWWIKNEWLWQQTM